MEAIAEQVIPADQDPGGKEAGVVKFIDIQLAGPYRRFLETYRQGLSALEQTAIQLFQKSFVELAFDRQMGLLVDLETDRAPKSIWNGESSSRFFRLICDHCLQGYYGSPRHGGNEDFVSWRMLGINYPQVCGRRRGE